MLKFAFLSKIIRDLLDTTTKALYICIIRKQQNNQTMTNSKENAATIKALKELTSDAWSDTATHQTIEAALVAINYSCGINSGWYNPKAVNIKGLEGSFMINKDGSLWYESRIVKTSAGFTVQNMTMQAFNKFESHFINCLDNL